MTSNDNRGFTAHFPWSMGSFERQPGILPFHYRLKPIWYRWTDEGGPDKAEFLLDLPTSAIDYLHDWSPFVWIGKEIHIVNPLGTTVWWGKIEEVDADLPGWSIRSGLNRMYNRIKILYSVVDVDGNAVDATTGWVEDSLSVERYGSKERIISIGEATPTEASNRAAETLALLGRPNGERDLGRSDKVTIRLTATGTFSTLSWQTYSNSDGLIDYSDLQFTHHHALGWQSSNHHGIFWTASPAAVHMGPYDHTPLGTGAEESFAGLPEGQKILCSGGVNDGKGYVILSNPNEDSFPTIEANDLYTDGELYSPTEDISVFDTWHVLILSGFDGSNTQQGAHLSEQLDLDASPPYVDFEGSWTSEFRLLGSQTSDPTGKVVQLSRCDLAKVPVSSGQIDPQQQQLTADGLQVSQPFTLSTAWNVWRVSIPLWRVGNPTQDVLIQIYPDDGTGLPTGPLVTGGSVTLSPADVPTESDSWVQVEFDPPLATGIGTYHILVNPDTTYGTEDFYATGLTTEGPGGIRLWDGSTWHARHEDAMMPFRIEGGVPVEEFLDDVVATCGQHLQDGSYHINPTGTVINQYREPDRFNGYEVAIKAMRAAGGGSRLKARTMPRRTVIFERVPTATSRTDPVWEPDGSLSAPGGAPWEPGLIPVGRYVRIRNAPNRVDELVGFNRLYVGVGEYDIDTGEWSLSPADTTDGVI